MKGCDVSLAVTVLAKQRGRANRSFSHRQARSLFSSFYSLDDNDTPY